MFKGAKLIFKAIWPISLLALVAATPFYRILFQERLVLSRDTMVYLSVKKMWLEGILREGRIPLWDYHTFSGFPHWADCIAGAFFPLNFIFLLFPNHFFKGYSFFIAANYVILAWGAYFLLRTLRFERRLAFLFSFPFFLGGVAVSAHLLEAISCMAAVPWLCGTWLRYLRNKKVGWLFLSSFFLVLPVLAGDPQYTFLLAILVAIFTLTKKSITWRSALFSLLSLCFLSLLAGAIQIIPTFDLILESTRGVGRIAYEEATAFSFHPIRVIEFFFYNFFGNYVPTDTYWGSRYVNGFSSQPYFFSYYVGTFTFVSLLLFFLRPPSLRKPGVLGAYSSILFLLLMGIGSFSPIPLYRWLFLYFPFWKAFRYPEKMIYWLSFFLLVRAAFSWRKLFFLLRVRERKEWAVYLGMLSIILLATSFLSPSAEAIRKTAFFVFLVGGVIYLASTRALSFKTTIALFTLISGVDLFLGAQAIVWDQPDWIVKHNPLSDAIKRDIKERGADIDLRLPRRYTHARLGAGPTNVLNALPLNPIGIRAYVNWDILYPNTHELYGLDASLGSVTFKPAVMMNLWQELGAGSGQRFFDLTSTYYIPERRTNGSIALLKNTTALPYLYFANHWQSVPDFSKALALVKESDFSKKDFAVFESANLSTSSNEIENNSMNHFQRDSKSFRFQINAGAKARVLVWNERFDKNWRAYLNGTKVSVLRANAWSMALAIPPVPDTKPIDVAFVYESPFIFWGTLGSALWLLLAAYFIFFSRRKNG